MQNIPKVEIHGNCFCVLYKNIWEPFSYVFGNKVGSLEWFKNLYFMCDIDSVHPPIRKKIKRKN